ncbi:hypothetical protein [Rhodoferax sp.]|uniref:hypothetical protein n=1 Tax=Rhodoferax sp. TaxID=50421 RepID=UPI0019F7EBD6|nr:hypothetical protein [Rhodoferax sp.]MBE0472814.1 hypothetical protein [Rhodoferax sp.]
MTPAELEETAGLQSCQASIRAAMTLIDARVDEYAREIQTRKAYMWDARRDMDHIEKIAVCQTIEQDMDCAEALKTQQQKLAKLMRSPYFGRFDFHRLGDPQALPVYVGVHHFRDDAAHETLIYD